MGSFCDLVRWTWYARGGKQDGGGARVLDGVPAWAWIVGGDGVGVGGLAELERLGEAGLVILSVLVVFVVHVMSSGG